MNNQMIGIASVFVLTFLLFVLRHRFLSLGRANKSGHGIRPGARRNNELNSSNKKPGEDDAWLFWTPEPNQTDASNRAHDELAEHRAAQRKGISPLR